MSSPYRLYRRDTATETLYKCLDLEGRAPAVGETFVYDGDLYMGLSPTEGTFLQPLARPYELRGSEHVEEAPPC